MRRGAVAVAMRPEKPPGAPAVLVWRGKVVESVHRAVIAVADPDGRLVARLGDAEAVTYLRSSAKPFQALPLVESGAADRFGLSPSELAVITGSHGGEDRHVKAVEGILAKAGLGPEALQCGVHKPYHGPTAERLGSHITALHHNCSGKHAGMLLLAAHLGVDPRDYIDPASAGQRRIRSTLADVAGVPLPQVQVGTDGCSAPNFALPMRAAARAFARLGQPESLPAHEQALRRVRDAMLAHPEMVAGEGRFDTALMTAFQGRVLSKSGAEGFEGLAIPGRGWGIAIKVEDGNARASPPIVVRTLRQLRVAGKEHEAALAEHLGREQKNWAGRTVGKVEARFTLKR
jgi:L-asparaginase II